MHSPGAVRTTYLMVSVESLGKLPGRGDEFAYRFKSHLHLERAAGLRASYSLLSPDLLL